MYSTALNETNRCAKAYLHLFRGLCSWRQCAAYKMPRIPRRVQTIMRCPCSAPGVKISVCGGCRIGKSFAYRENFFVLGWKVVDSPPELFSVRQKFLRKSRHESKLGKHGTGWAGDGNRCQCIHIRNVKRISNGFGSRSERLHFSSFTVIGYINRTFFVANV